MIQGQLMPGALWPCGRSYLATSTLCVTMAVQSNDQCLRLKVTGDREGDPEAQSCRDFTGELG